MPLVTASSGCHIHRYIPCPQPNLIHTTNTPPTGPRNSLSHAQFKLNEPYELPPRNLRRIRHLRRRLIPRELRPRAQLHLLLLLDEGAAPATEGRAAVAAARALDAEALAHLAAPDRLDDPLGETEAEAGEDGALWLT